MKRETSITSTTNPRKSNLIPWAVVLIFTVVIIAAYSLYIPNPAELEKVENLVKEQTEKTPSSETQSPHATEKMAEIDARSAGVEQKIQAAKQLPQSREVTEYIERLSKQSEIRDKVLSKMDQHIREVAALSPAEAARSLLETNFSRHFSPKLTSALYGMGLPPATLFDDALKDPLIAKVFSVLNDPTHPDFPETYEAIRKEAAEFSEHMQNAPRAFVPGSALALPMLLVHASPSPETALVLNEMQESLRHAENATLATFPNQTYLSTDMRRMLAYSTESLFIAIEQNEEEYSRLAPEQIGILAELDEYFEARNGYTRRLISALNKNTNETDNLSEAEMDNAFWQAVDMVPPLITLDSNLGHGANHELLLRHYLEQFAASWYSTNGDSSNEQP